MIDRCVWREYGPRCWQNRYRQGKRWALELCLEEVRWLDSMKAKEEKRAVVVHDVACAPAQREFDVVTVANPLCEAVHAVAVPRKFGVLVLGERQTNVQEDYYSRKIQALCARRLEMEKVLQEGIQIANED